MAKFMIFLISLSIISIVMILSLLIGRMLARLLSTKTSSPAHNYFICPLIGMSLIILICKQIGNYSQFNTYISISIISLLILIGLILERDIRNLIKSSIMVLIFSLLVSLPILSSVIHFDAFNTFNDTFTYLVHSQWLQDHKFSQQIQGSGNFPAESQIYLYQTQGSRMGASFFLAFLQSGFNLEWSYYVYLSAICIIFACGSLAISGTIYKVTGCNIYLSLLLGLLPAYSLNGFIYGSVYGFFPQTFGLSFVAGLIYLLPDTLNKLPALNLKLSKIFVEVLPLSLIASALILCYNDMFLIVLVGIITFIIYLLISKWELKYSLFKIIFVTSFQTIVFINTELLRIYKSLIGGALAIAKGVYVGWPVPWSPLEFLAHSFGLKSALSFDKNSLLYFLDLFISEWVFLLLLILLIVKLLKRSLSPTVVFILIINVIYIAAFLKFRYINLGYAPGEIGHSFLQWKISKWLVPFNLTLLGIFLGELSKQTGLFRLASLFIPSALILYGGYINIFITPRYVTTPFLAETGRARSAFNLFLDLRSRVAAIPKNEVIYLGIPVEHHKLSQMIMYALMDRKLAGKYADGYIRGSIPENQRDMNPSDAKWYLRYSPLVSKGENPLNRIGPLYLHDSPYSFYELTSIKDTYGTEGGDITGRWNWVEHKAYYIFNHFGVPNKLCAPKLRFEYLINGKGRRLFIKAKDLVSGKELYSASILTSSGWNEFTTPAFKNECLNEITIEIEADGDSIPISDSDTRRAKFVIKDIEILN